MAAPICRRIIAASNRLTLVAFHIRKVRCSSTATRDPASYFLDPEVQTILRKVTGFELAKIFAAKEVERSETPKYRFLTQQQFQELQDDSAKLAHSKLQMPPVMKVREDKELEITKDEEIAQFDKDCNWIFTDISYGLHERERLIVVRESNGLLRHATHEERDRVLPIYYVKDGRQMHMPQMLEPDHLETLLEKAEYLYVLERICVQLAPDHPDYIRVAHRTYEHIRQRGRFDDLRSTRFFGPMTFYFVFYDKADNFMLHLIRENRLDDAAGAVRLHCIMHPTTECATKLEKVDLAQHKEYITGYIDHIAEDKLSLSEALDDVTDIKSKDSVA